MSRVSKPVDLSWPRAVVLGLDHVNGIQTARVLARRGIPVVGVAKDPRHHLCRTRVCQRIVFADTAGEGLIDALEDLGRSLDQRAVLYPCADAQVMLVSRNRERLEPWYHVVLPAPEVVEMMIDKVRFYAFAQERGFPIPETRFLRGREDAERAAEELRFPVVLKPPYHATTSWVEKVKVKALRIAAPQAFLDAYRRTSNLAPMLIAQEWIEGPVTDLYSCNCYFDARSEPIVTFVARKIRQWPPEVGDSSLGEECRNDVVLRETVRLFSSVGWYGLGYLEMKRDARTGEHLIVEPNVGRPTARSAMAEAGGVELLATMYREALGLPLPPNRVQRYGNAKWVYLMRDTRSALHDVRRGELTMGGWWRSLAGSRADAVFSPTDPGPFIGDVARALRLAASANEWGRRGF